MFSYVLVSSADSSATRTFLRELKIGEVNSRGDSSVNGKPFILPLGRLGYEPFHPQTQIRGTLTYDMQTDKCVATIVVRAKTAKELDDEAERTAEADVNVRTMRVIDRRKAVSVERHRPSRIATCVMMQRDVVCL